MIVIGTSKYGSALFYIFLIVIIISCSDRNREGNFYTAKVKAAAQPINTGVNSVAARLRFVTGVRSILEDSKGNSWFGSYQEGICLLHNGKPYYFTTKNGLSDNQVRAIYEDKNGVIWFECGRGLSRYDGIRMIVYKEKNYHSKNE